MTYENDPEWRAAAVRFLNRCMEGAPAKIIQEAADEMYAARLRLDQRKAGAGDPGEADERGEQRGERERRPHGRACAQLNKFFTTNQTFAGRSASRRMYHANQYSPYAINTRNGRFAATSRCCSGR